MPARAALASLLSLTGMALAPAGSLAAQPAVADATSGRSTSVAFHFVSTQIDANTQPTVVYAAHKPRHGKILFQRKIGKHYSTISHLKGGSRTYVAPAVPQGRFAYRILVKDRHGHVVAQQKKSLNAYAPVALSTLLSSSTSTVNIAGREFRYVLSQTNYANGVIMKVDSTSCRSIDLQVGADTGYYSDTTPSVISFIQENADPASFDAYSNTVAEQTFGILGGSWEIDESGDGDYNLYANATLSCYTPTGSPSGLYY
jgi:hypothetical protein